MPTSLDDLIDLLRRQDSDFNVHWQKIVEDDRVDDYPLVELDLSNKSFKFPLKLNGANLTGTSFKNSDLPYADLRNTNLTGANFEKANLEGSNLTSANGH
jgi:uncharacterized protein YjbI with pentapeptide repeats